MDKLQLAEVLEVVPTSPVAYTYQRDQFALDQLARITRHRPQTVGELKKGSFAGLLRKPLVKDVLSALPDGKISPEVLYPRSWSRRLGYQVTLGKWGTSRPGRRTWHQLSRPGYNLVVQLNLTDKLVQRYEALIGKGRTLPSFAGHPVSAQYPTLGWARLDFDLSGQSVLIEELQSDLVRDIDRQYQVWHRSKNQQLVKQRKALGQFIKQDFADYAKTWRESLLACTLDFIDRELGYRQVFMHTWQGGNAIKQLSGSGCPPRSTYEQLPRSFGFRRTDTRQPDCVLNHHGKLNPKECRILDTVPWWHLAW